jgi:hypothetical protein
MTGITPAGTVRSRLLHHETAPAIDPEAQPPAAGRLRKTAQAVTA